VAAGSRWELEGFVDRLENLDGISTHLRQSFATWLTQLANNPAAVPRSRLEMGQHAGESGDEPEAPFPPCYRSRVDAGPLGSVVCDYFVHVDAWRVTCINLRFET